MQPFALKEWATVIAAMLAGDQVVMLRKGGIGEKRFDVPHREFLLLPTHVHQRPELLKPEVCRRWPELLAITDEPSAVDLTAWCEVADVHEVSEQAQLGALAPFHVLGPDYAEARLKWRPRHPLMVIVPRVHHVDPSIRLKVSPDMRGCRSWVEVPVQMPAASPVLGDAEFAAVREDVARALDAVRPDSAHRTATLG